MIGAVDVSQEEAKQTREQKGEKAESNSLREKEARAYTNRSRFLLHVRSIVAGATTFFESTEGESVRRRSSGSGSDGSGGGVVFDSGGGVGAAVAHSSLVAHRGDSW